MDAEDEGRLPNPETVSTWTCQDVADWLASVSLHDCVAAFKKRNIDGKAALEIYQETFLRWTGEVKISHQRQIAKYLNECRAKDGGRRVACKQGFRLNLRKTSLTPPPIPKQDYFGNANDSDVDDVDSDEGWDTEFEDDPEDDVEEKRKDHSDRDSGATNDIPELEPSSALQSQKNESQAIHSHFSHSCSDLQENSNAGVPKKRIIPRPPDHPVVPRKPAFPSSKSVEHLAHRLSVGRPQQQPPPPPPTASLHFGRKEETMPKVQSDVASDSYSCENYEIPNSVGSDRTSIGSMSINLPSEINGTIEEEYESLNSSVELPVGSVAGEDYEVVASDNLTSSANKPSLPPVLPHKLKGKQPLRPPLPIRITKPQEECGFLGRKTRPSLESCKNALSNLTSNLSSMFSDTRIRKQGDGGPSPQLSPVNKGEDFKESPTIKDSYPEVVRYVRRNDESLGLAQRPLPPPPPKKVSAAMQLNTPKTPENNACLIDSFPWFHRVERKEAENLLTTLGKPGSYLVRESRQAGEFNPYTLTIFNGVRMSHLNIRSRSDGTYALGTTKEHEKTFNSVEELISFHQTEFIFLTSKGQQAGKVRLLYHPKRR